MDFLHIYLDEFASIYENSLENIRKVETLAAISAINHNFTNNIRHALEHLSIAIKFALQNNPDKEQSTNYMKEAISHISNLAPDSCQHMKMLFIITRKVEMFEPQALMRLSSTLSRQ